MTFWAHYAANHTGYCLEFANGGPLFENAKEVNYLVRETMDILITDPGIGRGDFSFAKPLNGATKKRSGLFCPEAKAVRSE
jgi:hypothetical protein